MLVAVSVLAISLSLLIYHHPPSTWPLLFAQARHSKQPTHEQHLPAEEPETHRGDENISLASLSPQDTPKAVAHGAHDASTIPTFMLDDGDKEEEDDDDDDDNLPPPSFPAMNSAQRASAQPSLSKPQLSTSTPMAPPPRLAAPSLMPPPRVAPSNLRALPTSSQSMRIPTTGLLPNRGPVPNRGSPATNGSLGIPASAGSTPKTPNARGKVLLSPGHSPLDWANLQKSSKNLSGVDSLLRVTPTMLKEKNGRKGRPAWSSYQGKVYNISPYLPYHPGGEGELRRAAGKDGSKLFMEVHPWVNWENMLGECMVGIMVAEGQAPMDLESSLDSMD